ncbi:MAG: hypothetical protein ABIK90_03030 [candidate division WOR-3 bacterium]
MVKVLVNLYEKLKEMVKKYYLSLCWDYSKLTYKYYPIKIPLDLESLVNKDLFKEKQKKEVISEAYLF